VRGASSDLLLCDGCGGSYDAVRNDWCGWFADFQSCYLGTLNDPDVCVTLRAQILRRLFRLLSIARDNDVNVIPLLARTS
jgi:hypothetical protein